MTEPPLAHELNKESVRDQVKKLITWACSNEDDTTDTDFAIILDALEWIARAVNEHMNAIRDAFSVKDALEFVHQLRETGGPRSRTFLRETLAEALAPREPTPEPSETPSDELVRAVLEMVRHEGSATSLGKPLRHIVDAFDDTCPMSKTVLRDVLECASAADIKVRIARALVQAHPNLGISLDDVYVDFEATAQPAFEAFVLHQKHKDVPRVALSLALHTIAYPRSRIAPLIVEALRCEGALNVEVLRSLTLRRLGVDRPASSAQVSLLQKFFPNSETLRHLSLHEAMHMIDLLKGEHVEPDYRRER
jgi:hypothetical protein